MTEEQIKQNAEEYANTHKYTLDELNNSILTVDEIVRLAYIAGAHNHAELIEKIKDIVNESIASNSFSWQQRSLYQIQNLLKEE